MQMSYAFISHSSADEELAKQLAQRLGKENVWIDLEDLKAGDLIPRKLAESIHESKWFILIASQEAMESQWVRYELNVAIMNEIQDNDYRIIAARIDDCKVHPELLEELPPELPKRFRRIRDTIQAEMKLKQKQFEAARKLIKKYDLYSDSYLVDVAGRIELSDAMEAMGKKQLDIAKGRLKRGREIIERALRKFPENQNLQQTCELITKWEAQLKIWRTST